MGERTRAACLLVGLGTAVWRPGFPALVIALLLFWQAGRYLAAPAYSLLSLRTARPVRLVSRADIQGRFVSEARAGRWSLALLALLLVGFGLLRFLPEPAAAPRYVELLPTNLAPQDVLGSLGQPRATDQPTASPTATVPATATPPALTSPTVALHAAETATPPRVSTTFLPVATASPEQGPPTPAISAPASPSAVPPSPAAPLPTGAPASATPELAPVTPTSTASPEPTGTPRPLPTQAPTQPVTPPAGPTQTLATQAPTNPAPPTAQPNAVPTQAGTPTGVPVPTQPGLPTGALTPPGPRPR